MTVAGAKVAIVGGGIVGLAVAELLSRSGSEVVVLEKEHAWGSHQTRHNSGVIHAGPYYKPGSLKAELCRLGSRSLIRFAEEHGVPFRVTGKLIVATRSSEFGRLDELASRAKANDAAAEIIGADDAHALEPHVNAIRALHVKGTGIIDYGVVCDTLARLASAAGATLTLGAAVDRIDVTASEVVLHHSKGTETADLLINCAGLHSDRIAQLAGLRPEARIVPFRGEYYELVPGKRHLVNGLIYPVPDPDLPFLGVHFTRMMDGSVHAGPNAVLAFQKEGYRWRDVHLRELGATLSYPGFMRLASKNIATGAAEMSRSLSRSLFASSLARLVPQVTAKDIVRAGSGVRAQAILKDGSLADDFIIQRASRQVHVLNAPSPAATSALEIAKHIVHSLAGTR